MVTYLNPYSLKYFVDAVDLGSISASAQKNLISHPAVSKAIQNLENDLQISLLNHQRKNFEVTKEGFRFAIEAKKSLMQLEKLRVANLDQEVTIQGTISLGISRTLGKLFLKKIILILEKQLPRVHLDIQFGTTSDLTEKLLQGTFDSCLTIGKQTIPMLTQHKLMEGQFVLIQPKNKNKIIVENLNEFILTEPRYETELLKKVLSKKLNKKIQIKHQVGSWEVICDLVASDLGIGLVPDLLLIENNKVKKMSQSLFEYSYEVYLNKRNGPQTQLQKLVSELIVDVVSKTIN